ncbi:MAG: TraG family conjugative transposon ATPase, partial [Chitinophagaceae bacterium]|nr:TraG family conjugative transposon ATPase [Chitinophagaceae bacterium]
RLSDQVLVDLVNQYLLLDTDKVLRDIDFTDGIKVGEKHCTLFALCDPDQLPAVCGSKISYEKYDTDATKFPIGFGSPLGLLLQVNHIYNQYIFIDETARTLKQMESKKRRLQSLSTYSRENAFARDAVDQFLQEAVSENRLPIKTHFNVLAWSNDATQLQALRNQCMSAFAAIDAVPAIETVGAPQIYWAGIPGNAADLPEHNVFDSFSTQAACFFNLETNYTSSASPTGLRLGDRLTGQPLHVDLSDEPMKFGWISNRNKFIIGPSGSGKSFFTNHMLRSYYEQGSHVVMVDVGHSYKGLCQLVGGHYFSYSEQTAIQFNPFYLEVGDVPDIEKRESIKTLLIALWKKDDERFTRSEYVALSNAIQLYYEKNASERSFNHFYEFLKEDFVEVVKKDSVKDRDFDLDNFLYVLRPYYKGGEYDYLLNAATNMDLLNQRFIVFELDAIKDHPILLPVVTIIIMEVFISKMRKLKGIRKMILIEEAWKAIAREGMAEYIKYLFKTVRKHFGEAIVVTQEIEDIISSEIVKQAIIGSSDCKVLLDQSKYQHQFDAVQALLGLTEKDKALILSMNKANEAGRRYKEVFIALGNSHSKVYRVEVSPEEYLTYTTEEKEKLMVVEAAEKYGGMEAAIKNLVHEKP